MVTKTDLEAIAAKQIAPRVTVDGDLILRTQAPGDGNIYSLRVRHPDTSESVIGPHGSAAEFEYFLRGITYGLDLADGRYAPDDNDAEGG